MNICVVEFLAQRDAKVVIVAFMIFIKLIVDSPNALVITAALEIAGVSGIAKAADLNVFGFDGRGGEQKQGQEEKTKKV